MRKGCSWCIGGSCAALVLPTQKEAAQPQLRSFRCPHHQTRDTQHPAIPRLLGPSASPSPASLQAGRAVLLLLADPASPFLHPQGMSPPRFPQGKRGAQCEDRPQAPRSQLGSTRRALSSRDCTGQDKGSTTERHQCWRWASGPSRFLIGLEVKLQKKKEKKIKKIQLWFKERGWGDRRKKALQVSMTTSTARACIAISLNTLKAAQKQLNPKLSSAGAGHRGLLQPHPFLLPSRGAEAEQLLVPTPLGWDLVGLHVGTGREGGPCPRVCVWSTPP